MSILVVGTVVVTLYSVAAVSSFADVIVKKRDLAGKKICWGSYGTSMYEANGRYTFTGASKADHGKWSISKDGTVTTVFDDGHSRTDKFDVNAGQVTDLGTSGGSGTVCN